MIVRTWRTAKCQNIDEYETDMVSIGFDKDMRDMELEMLEENWEPSVCFTPKGKLSTMCIPAPLVIEIREE